jgi:hypothetical protein
MEKLDLLREAGASPKLAEAIVRTQEESEYLTKDYFDARLDARLREVENRLLLAVLGSLGLILGSIYFVLPRLIQPVAS